MLEGFWGRATSSGVSNQELDLLEELVRGGKSLADALRKTGLDGKISEKTARRLLIKRGVPLARLAFLGLSAGAWALLLGGGLLVIGGAYIYYRPDEPIQAGPAMTRPRPSPTPEATPDTRRPEVPATERVRGGAFVLAEVRHKVTELKSHWTVEPRLGFATFVLGAGDADHKWTVPDRIGPDGATIAYSATVTAGKGQRLSVMFGLRGEGLQFDKKGEERVIHLVAEPEQTHTLAKTTTIKAPASAREVVLVVEAGFSVAIEYVYRRES